MKGARVLMVLAVMFFVGGFAFFYHLLSYKNDLTHFADELIPYTDVTRPEINKVQVEYKGKEYNLVGWDVADAYTVINRGDGSRVKLIFKREPKTEFIKFTFKDAAEITVYRESKDVNVDKVIIKYHNLENGNTKYYRLEGLGMFNHLVEIVEPKKE